MKGLLRRYIPFLNSGEAFFVIELFGSVMRGSLLEVEPATKQVTVIKVEECQFVDTRPDSFIDSLPALLKKFRLPVAVRILALLDRRRAAMMSGSISLMRSDQKSEIRQAELENLVSQGLWKLVNLHRPVAAKALNVPEVQVLLADADVMQVRLDNHRVVNPVGFAARSVELWYRELFIDRGLLQRLTAALTEDNLTAVVEAPAVLASLVARVHPQSEFLFISVGARESIVYHADQMVCSCVDSFGWGTQTLLSSVAKYFGVTETDAAALLDQYGRHAVSKEVRKAIEQAASGELAILSNGIAAHQPSASSGRGRTLPVYVHGAVALPEFLFDQAFTRRLGLSLTLTAVNTSFIGQHTGFVVQLTNTETDRRTQYSFDAAVSVIADWYAVSAVPLVSKAAKQRGRWM